MRQGTRGKAVVQAVKNRQLDLLKVLLESGQISLENLDNAIWWRFSEREGCEAVMRAMLENAKKTMYPCQRSGLSVPIPSRGN